MRNSSNLKRVFLADALLAFQFDASPAARASIEQSNVPDSTFPISLAVGGRRVRPVFGSQK